MAQLTAEQKMKKLESILESYGSLAVAFSGGVDSTFLMASAAKVLKHNIAITSISPVHPERELAAAQKTARRLGVEHLLIASTEMEDSDFLSNRVDRCYICKKHLFHQVLTIAKQQGIHTVAHGANMDDLKDYRPGFRAAEEMNIAAPLVDAGLTKPEIRNLSKAMGLSTWNKPAMACLASRIPYGTSITPGLLSQIEKAEGTVFKHGFTNCRVRHHGQVARIEVDPAEFKMFFDPSIRQPILAALKEIGYLHVCVDLEGYVQGSMNRSI